MSKMKRAIISIVIGLVMVIPAWFIGSILAMMAVGIQGVGLESAFFIGFFMHGPLIGLAVGAVTALAIYHWRNRNVLVGLGLLVAAVLGMAAFWAFINLHPWGVCQKAEWVGELPYTLDRVAFSPDGQLLAGVNQWDSRVMLWQAGGGQKLDNLCGPGLNLADVAFGANGQTLWALDENGQHLRVWDVPTWRVRETQTLPGNVQQNLLPEVNMIAFGVWTLYSNPGVPAETIEMWSIPDEAIVNSIGVHFQWDFAVTQDGQMLAVDDGYEQINILTATTGEVLQTLTTPEDDWNMLYFSPDGQLLAEDTLYDGPLRVWHIATGENIFTQPDHAFGAFSPDGQTLATIAADSSHVYLWNIANGDLLQTLAVPEGGVDQLVFSPDGQKLALVMYRSAPQVWDLPTGERLYTLLQ